MTITLKDDRPTRAYACYEPRCPRQGRHVAVFVKRSGEPTYPKSLVCPGCGRKTLEAARG